MNMNMARGTLSIPNHEAAQLRIAENIAQHRMTPQPCGLGTSVHSGLSLSPLIQPGAIVRAHSFITDRDQGTMSLHPAKFSPYLVWGIGHVKDEDAPPIIYAFKKTTNTSRAEFGSQYFIAAGTKEFGRNFNDRDCVIDFSSLYALPATTEYFPQVAGNSTLTPLNNPLHISAETWSDLLIARESSILWDSNAELNADRTIPPLTSYEGVQLPLSYNVRDYISANLFRNFNCDDPAHDIQDAPTEPRSKISWAGHGLSDQELRATMIEAYWDAAEEKIRSSRHRREIAKCLLTDTPCAPEEVDELLDIFSAEK